MSRYRLLLTAICFALLLGLTTGLVSAQGPRPARTRAASTGAGLTYQGFLQQDGRPVDGQVDLQFTLWDAAEGGVQVGDAVPMSGVAVDRGLFTVPLDFGPVFDGRALWLAIAVRHPAGSGEFTPLARQALTAAPYALHALYAQAAPWSGLGEVPAGFADNTDDDTLAAVDAEPGQVLQWDGSAWSGATVTSTEYSAGAGLILTDTVFSIDWAGSGSAATVARGDHDHAGVYALTGHGHGGEDIAGGIIADARIDASIARDTEIISLLLAQDGEGSGLDADLLDGQHAAAFAGASHTHPGGDITTAVSRAVTATYAALAGEVPWSGIAGTPSGFVDGIDDDTLGALDAAPGQVPQWSGDAWVAVTVGGTSYTPDTGLVLTGTLFSVDFAGSGALDTVARSDHDHAGVYAPSSHNHDELYALSGHEHGGLYAATSHEHTAADVVSGTLDTALYSAYADLAAEGRLGNSPGGLALNDGTLQPTLNADLLDDQHAAAFAPSSHLHAASEITGAVTAALTATQAALADAVPWLGITDVPGDFTDGVDNDTLAGLPASEGQVLQWDGSAWVAAAVGGDHFGARWTGSITPSAGLEVANATGHGLRGESSSASSAGVYAINNSSGLGLYVRSVSGANLIEVYGSEPGDRKFSFRNNGSAYADGNWATGAGDFAELLPAQAGLEPGDVLAIGPDGTLVRSTRPYDTSVAGVHSTEPGFTGGASEDGDETGKVPLAVVGVVPVKASAENGAIRPGDLLVASSTPGHAMRAGANPPQGTVIGKALGKLARGTGVIRMLVTLQ